jgi:alpha-D-xyloside xylohydrolase
VPLDRLPVYVREGHILALGKAVAHTGEIDRKNPVDEIRAYGMPTTAPVVGDGVLSLEFEGARAILSGAPDARLRVYEGTVAREGSVIVFGR